MKKVLQVASVASMIDQFNMENIRILQELGYKVEVAANFEFGSPSSKSRINEFKRELDARNIPVVNLLFSRKIFDFNNIKVYRQLKKLIGENKYDIVHCHSPIGGVITRLAARKYRKNGTKVIYTAHGFHFFKGGPIKDWLLFYPVEKFLSKYTDLLITINKEDFDISKNKFKAINTEYIPGVGLDTIKFKNLQVDINNKRREIGVPNEAIMLFSVGELSKRKNHEVVINALSKIEDKNIFYVICGQGELYGHLLTLSKQLGIDNRVILLGFRTDIAEICKCCDIYIFPSRREGLGIAALEGMASGKPLISSYINGIKDYTEDGKTGYCLDPFDINGFSRAINELVCNSEFRNEMGEYNKEVVKKFDINNVNNIMNKIYKNI